MTKYLFLILFISLFSNCEKDIPIEVLADKILYSGIEIGPLERYVVKDPSNFSYDKISDNSSLISKAKLSYDSIFEIERIDTIEFKNSFNSKYSIYSKGVIINTINGHFTHSDNFLSIYQYINPIFTIILIEPNGIYKFPHHMSFCMRQSKYPDIENIVSKGNFSIYSKEERIRNQIKTASLKMNDTVYYNDINLIYKAF